MNFIFISPNFPTNYWQFCRELKNNGMNVLGIGDAPYDELLTAAKKNGYRTMRDSCRELVLRGVTTAEEASRTINSTLDE